MTWDYNQESVFLQMDILGMRKRGQRCFESSVAVLLPQLLHYSPSVEEWYHQMRSSLYLFSLLFSLPDTELPVLQKLHGHQSQLNISLKAFDLVRSRVLHHFIIVDRLDPRTEQSSHLQWFPDRFRPFPAFLPAELPQFVLPSFSDPFSEHSKL